MLPSSGLDSKNKFMTPRIKVAMCFVSGGYVSGLVLDAFNVSVTLRVLIYLMG